MLDKETSEKLQAAVLERLSEMLPDESGIDKFIQSLSRLAVLASVITLEEYEKLNSPHDQPFLLDQ